MTTVELPTAKYDSINVPALMNWILELESGKTEQGHHRLHTVDNGTDKLCCLGVVSRQLVEPLDLAVSQLDYGLGISKVSYNGVGGFAPFSVLNHIGIPPSHREDRDSGYTVLVSVDEAVAERLNEKFGLEHWSLGELISVHLLNDNKFSFVEIAALLRKEFLNA